MTEQTPGPEKNEKEHSQQTRYSEDKREERKQRWAERNEYRYDRRTSDGIGVGVTFIFIGIIWMMAKLGYLNFSVIAAIFDLWPLIFVVIGVNIIFKKVPYVGIVTWVGFLSAIVAYGVYFSPQDNWIDWTDRTFDENQSISADVSAASSSIPMEGNEQVKEGNISLNLSAGNLNMGVSENQLIDYVIPKNYMNTNFEIGKNSADLTFSEKNNINLGKLSGKNINYDFFLNKSILWYIDVNAGAMDSHMNFSGVPVRDLEINGGAGEFQIELGDLQEKSDVSINMAAGDVEITVPKTVGVRIINNGLATDNNFKAEGLDKVEGAYETPDYDNAAKIINIEISSAASDITLTRK